jgi:hypothetical protein
VQEASFVVERLRHGSFIWNSQAAEADFFIKK